MSLLFSAVGCARQPNISSYDKTKNTLFVGCQAYILLYCPETDTRKYIGCCGVVTCLSADGFVAYGTEDGSSVLLRQSEDGEWETVLVEKLEKAVCSIALSACGDSFCLAMASYTKEVTVIEGTVSAHKKQKIDLSDIPLCICLARYGESLLAFIATTKYTVACWRKETGSYRLVKTLSGPLDFVRSLSCTQSGDDLFLLGASGDRKIHVWRASPGFVFETKAVLAGHREAINSAAWFDGSLSIVSSSNDKTVLAWKSENKTWTPDTLVSGGVLCFSVCSFSRNATEYISACGYNGTVSVWKKQPSLKQFSPHLCFTGHIAPARTCSWNDCGELLTGADDMTTRLWSDRVCKHGCDKCREAKQPWREVARPQTHGYGIKKILSLSAACFISVSDEKILRVLRESEKEVAVPELSLSSKETEEEKTKITCSDEKDLGRKTMWSEEEKLYGHTNNAVTACLTKDRAVLASSCFARRNEDAVIRMWETETWKELPPVRTPHRLTVTALSFSSSGVLLCVSRDRSITAYRDGTNTALLENAHGRTITACAWIAADRFVTASKDSTIKTWRLSGEEIVAEKTFPFPCATTAIAVSERYIAAGCDNGAVYLICRDTHQIEDRALPMCPRTTVTSLEWNGDTLAVCSTDCSVRLLSL
ncbi:MAG: elongator complex protein 2 [Amphiamblys sp. WSBS2006]|nr:MAG: elongator complex protein 2 [Amphiamblys sp. WSBS2006]